MPMATSLAERFLAHAGRIALASGEQLTTYSELGAAIDEQARKLSSPDFRDARVIAIEGAFERDSIALLLAAWQLGKIVVPLTTAMRPLWPQFLEVSEANFLFALNPSGVHEATAHRPAGTELQNRLYREKLGADVPGLVLFTSGTSAAPKGVLHDAGRLLSKFDRERSPKSILSFLLFDHIGGVDTMLRTLTSGGTLVRPAARTPSAVLRALEAYRVDTLPASPTFLQMLVLSGEMESADLSALRVIAYGTEPMPSALLKRLGDMLPHVSLVQTYGTSELGVLPTVSKGRDSLWLQFQPGDSTIKIVDGSLWVRAPGAMLGYLNAEDQFDDEGFFNTFDMVKQEGDYLRILGRRSELINVGGQKVYPAEVEDQLVELDNVGEVLVFGKPSPLMGHMVAAKFRLLAPESEADFKRRMHAFCRERMAPYQIPRYVELSSEGFTGARLKKMRAAP